MKTIGQITEPQPTAVDSMKELVPRIEDHALIGDMCTAALVTKGGSIDWLCVPDFDSDACFSSIIGTEKNGYWKIAPIGKITGLRRRYRKDTLILETDFITETGTTRLIDFMPPKKDCRNPQIFRSVHCIEGSVKMQSEVSPRFAYGYAVPRVIPVQGATKLFAGPDALFLRGGPGEESPEPVSEFTLSAGESVSYSLTYGKSYEEPPRDDGIIKAEQRTEEFWTRWASSLHAPEFYRDLVVRSLITLKACIYEPSGGLVAAPTTSLPETPRGSRNWDYRYCWLRDGALSIHPFVLAGLQQEARAFSDWILRAVAGDPSQVQIMYGIRGERRLTEVELDWLNGYDGAKPVRIGNAAYHQRQLDVFGELAAVIYEAGKHFKVHRPEAVRSLFNIARYVAKVWQQPDRGIWEMRGPERSFTASKVAAWTAVDRAIRYAEEHEIEEAVDDMRVTRDTIFDEVCREGYNSQLHTFTQYYGGTDLDASLLFIPLSGFLPATDPRVVGTAEALERELMQDGFLLRFRTESGVDGLSGEEGVFLACSFWLVQVYYLMGRKDDAHRLFNRLISTANDLGLCAEEYDTKKRRQLGNFPQAFSHFALVNTAFLLAKDKVKEAGIEKSEPFKEVSITDTV